MLTEGQKHRQVQKRRGGKGRRSVTEAYRDEKRKYVEDVYGMYAQKMRGTKPISIHGDYCTQIRVGRNNEDAAYDERVYFSMEEFLALESQKTLVGLKVFCMFRDKFAIKEEDAPDTYFLINYDPAKDDPKSQLYSRDHASAENKNLEFLTPPMPITFGSFKKFRRRLINERNAYSAENGVDT